MDMTGSHRIEAPRDQVWAALNDPEILRRSIPGCDEVVKLSDTDYTARVVAKVGPVSAKFSGKVTLSDIDPPNGMTMTGEGSGGAAGFGKGGAKVTLTPDGTGTVLAYEVHAQVGGKLAQIGSRLVDAAARKMADDFFARLSNAIALPPPPAEAVGSDSVPPNTPVPIMPVPGVAALPEVPLPLPATRGRGGFYVPWLALVVVAVLAGILAFSH